MYRRWDGDALPSWIQWWIIRLSFWFRNKSFSFAEPCQCDELWSKFIVLLCGRALPTSAPVNQQLWVECLCVSLAERIFMFYITGHCGKLIWSFRYFTVLHIIRHLLSRCSQCSTLINCSTRSLPQVKGQWNCMPPCSQRHQLLI